MARVCSRMTSSISSPSECGGRTQAESPEWMPASSTCCMIAADPGLLAVAQGVDVDLDRVLEEAVEEDLAAAWRRLGAPGSSSARRGRRRSPSPGRRARSWAGRAAGSRPARRSPGPPRPSAPWRRAAPCSPRRPSSSPKRPRSSARSMASTSVPSSGTPASARPAASLSGVWPPNWTITPSGCSTSITAEHVLERQRLEVQAVGGVVVGGDRLGVAVDHHRVAAGRAHRPWRRARSSSRTRCPGRCGSGPEPRMTTLGAIAPSHLAGPAAPLPARVEVRRLGLELGGAGVDRLERALAAERAPRGRPRSRRSSCRNHGSMHVRAVDLVAVGAARAAPRGARSKRSGPGVSTRSSSSSTVPPACTADVELARAHRLARRPAGRCGRWPWPPPPTSCGWSAPGRARELLEGEARPLDHGVVDGRLEARPACAA